jgi:hypothetical protein
MWGMRRRLGPEEQSPRDRSKGRMCVTSQNILFWKTAARQNNLNGRLSPSWACIPGEASRLLLLCEEKRIDFARWQPFRRWPINEVTSCLMEVRLFGHSELDLLTLSSSHFDP